MTRRSTGHTPHQFYVEPILPFGITLATFLDPNIATKLSTADLIAIRTRQLQKREADLATISHQHPPQVFQFCPKIRAARLRVVQRSSVSYVVG